MDTLANKRKVVEAFKNHKPLKFNGSRSLNLWTNGETIFSYAKPLVSHESDGTLHWFYEGRPSTPTTSRHMNFIEMELNRYER